MNRWQRKFDVSAAVERVWKALTDAEERQVLFGPHAKVEETKPGVELQWSVDLDRLPDRGEFTMPGWPVKMSASHVPITAAPLLGADNEDVYGEWAGYTVEQLAALKEDGVI